MARKGKKRFYRKNVSKRIKRYVQNAIHYNIEDKYYSRTLITNFSSIGSTYIEQDLTNIVRGDQPFQRIGSEVMIRSVQFIGTLVSGAQNTVADDRYNTVRCVLGLYNTAYAGLTPLTSSGFGGSGDTLQWINKKNCTLLNWKLWDKVTVLSTQGVDYVGVVPGIRLLKFYKKFKRPIRIRFYDDNPGTKNQSLILSCVSDSVAVPNPGFTAGTVTIRYEDA